MMGTRLGIAAIVIAMAMSISPATGAPQIGSLRKKAEEAKKKIEESSKKPADTAKAKGADTAKAKGATTNAAPAPGTPATAAPSPAASSQPAAKADAKMWENYDFVPGNKVLFYTDFSDDRVGNFARGLKYRSGPVEIIERDGVKMLRATGRAEFLIPLGRKLPERFTLEIDAISPAGGALLSAVAFEGGAQPDGGDKSAYVVWNTRGSWIQGSGGNMATSGVQVPDAMTAQLAGNLAHLRVLMDSGYFKMYVNERRLHNRPELQFKRDTVIRVLLDGSPDDGMAIYVASIRVAESETDVMYDALLKKGRWVTQGILFATGKADVQPESRPVLKEIASTMKKYGDLKILIEGHTDNVGAAASNLSLSDARAAAVKAALVADFGIDGSRVTTKGFGDTKPAMPNATAVGRAQNRRVELVKQ
jgi:OmpA-OmpF porin, OOP family